MTLAIVNQWKSEREFQAAIFQRTKLLTVFHPEYRLLYHVSNENAHRNPGVKGGIPDIHWPIARGEFHSLYIELKIKKTPLRPEQVATILLLQSEGNFVRVIRDDLDEVMKVLDQYLHYKG